MTEAMILRDISFKSPVENIVFDEVLLNLAEKGELGETLRFWESGEYFVVLGRISEEEKDVHIDKVTEDNIPVLRRCSGGGTVLQGKGCLNYSLVLSKEKDKELFSIKKSYEYILKKIVDSLKITDVVADYYPISDIALVDGKKKISGNAQKRSKKYILHHGTMLYDFDLKKIEMYLKMPSEVPDYRKKRDHLDFIANVNVSSGDIKKSISEVFCVKGENNILSEIEKKSISDLVLKYS